MSDSLLEHKVAVVTGAGAGLGRAAALAFAGAGASVVCNDLDEGTARETAALVEDGGGRAIASVGSTSEPADVQAMVDTAVESFGGLDIMHANAAVSIYTELELMDLETLDSILAVDLRGPLLCARAAIGPLRARGGGSIIFVSSVQAYQGLPGCVPYVAAKAGLVGAARTLATEVGRYGIRVNAIAPGTIDTPMLQRDLSSMNVHEQAGFLARVDAANTLGRVGRPDEVADTAVFLASDRASYITGTCLVVDGGFLALKTI